MISTNTYRAMDKFSRQQTDIVFVFCCCFFFCFVLFFVVVFFCFFVVVVVFFVCFFFFFLFFFFCFVFSLENRIWHLMQIVSICTNCQILFSGKNKKNISKCRLLNIIYPECYALKHHCLYLRKQIQLIQSNITFQRVHWYIEFLSSDI